MTGAIHARPAPSSDPVEAPIWRSLTLDARNTPYAQLVREIDSGQLDLDAPYQRGHVWGPERQRTFIRSLMMGLPTAAIYVNDRDDDGLVVIDGKQRLTAVRRFLADELAVPASWVGTHSHRDIQLLEDIGPGALERDVSFSGLTLSAQRGFTNHTTVSTYWTNFTGPDAVEQEMELFNLLNFGGVAQGDTDLRRD